VGISKEKDINRGKEQQKEKGINRGKEHQDGKGHYCLKARRSSKD
jgi:hypothetical protein